MPLLGQAGSWPVKAVLEALYVPMTVLRKLETCVDNGEGKFMQMHNWLKPAKLCPVFLSSLPPPQPLLVDKTTAE